MNRENKSIIAGFKPNTVMFLFSLIYFVSYLTRINYAAVISEIITEEKIGRSAASLAITGAFITYGIGQVISGWMCDRFQPAKLVDIALLTTSSMNLIVPFCGLTAVRTVVWCINGIAQAFIWPPLVRMIPELLEPEQQLKAGVRISWGGHIGNIAIYILAPILISLSGWRAVFLFSSAAGFITLGLWVFCCKGFSVEFKSYSKIDGSIPEHKPVIPVALLLIVILTIILQGSLRDGVTTWMPSYISETFSLGNNISILTGVAMPLFALFCIWGTEYMYYHLKSVQKCCIFYFVAALIAAALIPAASRSNIFITVLLASILVGSMHGINILQTCMLPRKLVGNERLGLFSGIFNGCVYIGSAVSTYGFAGISETFGWNGTVITWCIVSALGALLCGSLFFMKKDL